MVLTNAEEIIIDFNIRGSLGCNDHTMVEFVFSRSVGLTKSGVRTLTWRANFRLFKELLDVIPWETVLRDRGTKQSWQHFKDVFLRAQELSITRNKKSASPIRKPAWLSKDLLVKLREKKDKYK